MHSESKRGLLIRCALLLLAACTFAGPTLAQSASDRETARSLMDQGEAAMSKNDPASALKAFQAADQIMHVPTTGISVARAQAALGKLVDARETALSVTRISAKPDEPPVFAAARREAKQLADSLAGRIPSLTIKLGAGAPAGAKVTLDGAAVAPSSLGVPKQLDPGKHVVVASAPGFEDARAEANLDEGEQEIVTLKLHERAGSASGTPAAARAEESASGGTSSLVYIGFGVGAVGVAVGSITGLMSLSKTSSTKDQCDGNQCPASAKDDADAAKTLATISNIGFGVGLVGIGVGVYGLLSSKPKSSERPPSARSPRVEPIVGARFVGVRGSF